MDYGVQIYRGLAAAHERGVVHRDLKPENLFLTKDGQIKILDFGLAKLSEPAEEGDSADSQGPTATEPGLAMGTAGYMSPEQARGRPADTRSDLFSLGAILYEMLSGRRAFSRDTAADTHSAILYEDPPEMQTAVGVVPPGLERVVRRCLEKNPPERIQSARDLAFHLEARPTESLEAYQAYLRGLEHLWDPDETRESQELAVQMFERAVEHDPDFVEAHALLAGAHVSMYNWDRTPERLARAREAVDRALALDPESPDAHLVLGRYHERRTRIGYTQFAGGDLARALEEYTFVAKRRPNDSVAANAIAWVRIRQGQGDEGMAQLERALALDPRNATFAQDLGYAHIFLARYPKADGYLDLAISLAPDKWQAYRMKVMSYMAQGRLDRARATAESMPEVDQADFFFVWADLERWERNYQAALDRLAAVHTGAPLGWKKLEEGLLYRLMKQPEQARVSHEAAAAVLEDVVTKRPDDIHSRARLARAYAGAGRKAEALREADRVVELFPIFKSGGGAGMSMVSATVAYTTAGEHEAALDVLEFLASIPSWVSYGYLRFEPALDPLREYPRFQKLLADKKKQLPPL